MDVVYGTNGSTNRCLDNAIFTVGIACPDVGSRRLSGRTRETMALPGSLHELEAKALLVCVYCLSHLYITYKQRS